MWEKGNAEKVFVTDSCSHFHVKIWAKYSLVSVTIYIMHHYVEFSVLFPFTTRIILSKSWCPLSFSIFTQDVRCQQKNYLESYVLFQIEFPFPLYLLFFNFLDSIERWQENSFPLQPKRLPLPPSVFFSRLLKRNLLEFRSVFSLISGKIKRRMGVVGVKLPVMGFSSIPRAWNAICAVSQQNIIYLPVRRSSWW